MSVPNYANEYPTLFCHVNDVSIAYQDLGDPKNEAVLLIMGAGEQMLFWPDRLIHGLIQKSYRVIRFDNRDIGLSTKFPEPIESKSPAYTLEDMTKDSAALLNHLSIKKAHIIGHSMGGAIGQLFASKYSSLCLTLILISCTMRSGEHEISDEFGAKWHQLERAPAKTFEEKVIQARGFFDLISGDYPLDSEWNQLSYQLLVRSEHGGQHALAEMTLPDRSDVCANISQPTTIICGDKDVFCPLRTQEEMHKTIRHSQLHIIPGMGHTLPKEVIGDILKCCMSLFKTPIST